MVDILKKLIFILDSSGKKEMIKIFFFLLITACLETIGVGLIMPYIIIINDPSFIEKFPIALKTFNLFHAHQQKEIILLASIFLIFTYFLKNIILSIIYLSQFQSIFRQQCSIANRLLEKYLKKPYNFHLQRNTAELLRTVNSDVNSIVVNIITPLFICLSEVFIVSFILFLLFFVNPTSSLIIFPLLGVATFLIFIILRKKNSRLGLLFQDSYTNMIKWVNQGLGGIKETKVRGLEKYFVDRYSHYSVRNAQTQGSMQALTQIPRFCIETTMTLGIVTIVLFGLYQDKNMTSLVSLLALFATSAIRLMPSMNRILNSITILGQYKPSLNSVYKDMCDISSDKTEDFYKDQLSKKNIDFKDGIFLKNICYKYPATSKIILKNIDLTIRKNDRIAIIGKSGAGKTTLIDLILGLLKPTSGQILVDGIDISTDTRNWQKKIGYVPQSVYLSDDSLRRNIAFGLSDEEIDDHQVWRVIKDTQLEQFIRELPSQLDTFVGERGIRLSGGQKQRLGIARVLYHNPSILILDEATSALDHETEQEIINSMTTLEGKTFIIISHRLTTTKHCNKTFNLVDGKILPQSTFDQYSSLKILEDNKVKFVET